MAKSSKEQIEQDEIKVLDALERHSKDSVDEIAKSCGFSRQKVWRIIKDLEKRKVIWGYTVIDNAEDRDLTYFILLMKRSHVPLDDVMQKEVISEKLDKRFPFNMKISDILITHGVHDAIVTFYAPDIVAAKKVVNELFGTLGKYFEGYQILETLFPIRKNGFKNPQIKDLVDYI